MSQRVDRLSGEIRQILSEIVTRQEIKDPGVRDAGLITFTHVRLTGDLRQATALFMVHGVDRPALERVREGLQRASGYVRHRLGKALNVRAIPTVSFEIDEVFEKEARVDALLREIAPPSAAAATAPGSGPTDLEPDEDPPTHGEAAVLEPDDDDAADPMGEEPTVGHRNPGEEPTAGRRELHEEPTAGRRDRR